jgi:hypothetical protein
MKPHKHAELIKAWADGATIEMLCGDNGWYTLTGYFCWSEDTTYRIKPELVYRQLIKGEIIKREDEYLSYGGGGWYPLEQTGLVFDGINADLTRTTCPAPAPKPEVKPDYVISVNLNLTLDGTTNQLKSAEVIK